MLPVETILHELKRLPKADRWYLVKHLLDTLETEQETLTSVPHSDWHDFLRETYGLLRDTPIERWDQGEYEEREPLK